MKIILDDWLVIIEWQGKFRIFNTELWIEWGKVGTENTTDTEKRIAELKVIQKSLDVLLNEQ